MLLKSLYYSFALPRGCFLVEGGLCLWPVLFKKMLYHDTKIIMMIPEPAFNWRNRSAFKNSILRFLFNEVDYFIPISTLVAEDLNFYTREKKPFSIVHHFPTVDIHTLLKIQPGQGKNILFVINRPQETGVTKGLDIVFKSFDLIYRVDPQFQLYLIGSGTEDLDVSGFASRQNIHLEGYRDIIDYCKRCQIVIAPARYDAFPLAIVEGCLAGQIPLISDITGAKEFVGQVNSRLVVEELNPTAYAERVMEIYSWSIQERRAVTDALRQKASIFTRDHAKSELEKAFQDIKSRGIIS